MRLTDGTDVEFPEHSGSRRADVWEELRAQTMERIPRAASQFAQVRADLNNAETHLKRLFERYEQYRVILEDGGVVAQMKLSPMLDAAHGAWLRDRDVPRRIELAEISEAPIPPEDQR